MGLPGMINSVVAGPRLRPVGQEAGHRGRRHQRRPGRHRAGDHRGRDGQAPAGRAGRPHPGRGQRTQVPVLGITGTGGSGKSSLTDELVRRLRIDQQDKLRVAVVAVDPTRRKGGGALLGDRIRMNSLDGDRTYFRSLGHPRRARAAGLPRRRDHGAQGGRLRPRRRRDARHRPGRRGRGAVRRHVPLRHDAGVRRGQPAREDRHARLRRRRGDQQVRAPRRRGRDARRRPPAGPQPRGVRQAARGHAGLRHQRRDVQRRRRHRALPAPRRTARRARPAPRRRHPPPRRRAALLEDPAGGARPTGSATCPRSPRRSAATTPAPTSWSSRPARVQRLETVADAGSSLSRHPQRTSCAKLARGGPRRPRRRDQEAARGLALRASRSTREHPGRESLSGNRIPRVSLPTYDDHGELVQFWRRENLPGRFPFTAGVFPFKRENEDPARMFAGEGDPARTNRRFKVLSEGQPADPAEHGVRLGDPLRPRPRRAARHLRQGRHLRRQRRDARRHEGALRRVRPARPHDRREHDDQRPGADGAGVLPQHRDRPGPRARPRPRA